MINSSHKEWVWHLIFWVSYLSFKIYHEFVWVFPKYEQLSMETVLWESAIAQTTMLPAKIAFTYWLCYSLLPSQNRVVKKWIYFAVGLIAAVFIYRLFVVYITLPLAYKSAPEEQDICSFARLTSAIIDILFVAGLAAALLLYRKNQHAKKETAQLEKEKINSELKFLRQQTNPHFFLNTLNNLYALARKSSPETPKAIMQLSTLMRYVLYESSYPSVPVSRELKTIRDYLALEHLRFGDRLQVEMKSTIDDNKQHIAPLLLLPVIENAFKHGASETENFPFISINLKIEDGQLDFQVRNNVPRTHKNDQQGIGLINLKRQLDLQYPDHKLTVSQEKQIFCVHLQLTLANEIAYEKN